MQESTEMEAALGMTQGSGPAAHSDIGQPFTLRGLLCRVAPAGAGGGDFGAAAGAGRAYSPGRLPGGPGAVVGAIRAGRRSAMTAAEGGEEQKARR